MMKKINNIWVYIILVLVIPFGLHYTMNYYESNKAGLPILGPKNLDSSGNEIQHRIPAFKFLDQDSLLFDSESLDGKIWVANYFFTSCPTICPTMMRNMQLVQEAFLDDPMIEILSLTVDPKHDIPTRFRKYAKGINVIDRKWHLLTGDKIDLYRLARKGFLITASEGDGGPTDFIHSENFVLIDRDGRIRFYYDGTEKAQVNQLLKDIAKLKRERS